MSSIEIIVPGGITDTGGGPITVVPTPGEGGTATFRIIPAVVRRGEFIYITALGENVAWDGTSTMAIAGNGITAHSTAFISSTYVVGIFTFAFDADLGFHDVTVTTGYLTDTLTDGIEVIRLSGGSYNIRRHGGASFISPKESPRDKLAAEVRRLREHADEEALLRLLD